MKKLVSLLVVVGLVVLLFACSATPAASSAASTSAAPAATSAAPAASSAAPAASSAAPASSAAAASVDWKNFKIDPSKIPQDKLKTTLYVAASVRGLDNPYIVTIIDGMKMFGQYLDSIGQKYQTQTLDSGGDSNKEVDNMRQFAAKAGGNAIAYSDPNESAIAPSLAQAMAQSGGFIGTAWNKPDDVGPKDYSPNWVVHTSPDNVTNAAGIAEEMFKKMGGKGKIFDVEGMLGNTAATDREKGLVQALQKYPDIKVVSKDTANWDTKQALNLVQTWLNQNPDVGGIFCANDNMAMGAIQALDQKGLKGKVPVVSIDAITDSVNAVKNGSALATVSSNGYLQGGYTLAICYAAWTGLIDPTKLPDNYRQFATPAVMITSANVNDYISKYVTNKPTFDFSQIFACKADN